MNTRKGYKMLVITLFVAFISLISRSIIYLVLSVGIAGIIIFLLSSDKKARKTGARKETVMFKEPNKKLINFLWVTTIIGGISAGYGSLFFTSETFFRQLIPPPGQMYSAILFISLGFFVVLGSMYFLLKEGLMITSKKSKQISNSHVVYCGHCGEENNSEHIFCSSCGKRL